MGMLHPVAQFSLSDICRRPLFYPVVILIGLILLADIFYKPIIDPSILNKKGVFEGILLDDPQVKDGKTKLELKLTQQITNRAAVWTTVREDFPCGPVVLASPICSPNWGLVSKPETKKINGRVLLTLLGEEAVFKNKSTIRFETKLKEPLSYKNPGGFDYARYLKRKKIAAAGFIDDLEKVQVINPVSSNPFQEAIKTFKKEIKQKIQGIGSPQAQGVLIALLWGEEAYIDQETEELFRDQGLSHILVISGLQFVALTLFLFYFIRLFLGLYPKLFLKIPAPQITAILTLICITFYFFLCESSPSVTRATIAISCYLGAILLNRARDILNILFLAAFIILLINPFDLYNLSFQFSFVSVLSLILIYPVLKRLCIGIARRGVLRDTPTKNKFFFFFEKIGDLVLVNISIFIGLTPLIIFYFHRTQWNGPFMNLWVVPLIELIVVPLGLLVLICQLFIPPLVNTLLTIDLFLIDFVIHALKTIAPYFPKPTLTFPPHGWELSLYYFLIFTFILKFSRRLKLIFISLIVIIFFTDILVALHFMYRSNVFRITHLDVGQGDALFVELPGAKRVLIDAGGSSYFDIGESVILPYLLYKRIPKLDAICITHADSDHFLGFFSLIESMKIKELWWNGIPTESAWHETLLNKAEAQGIKNRQINSGSTINMGPKAIFTVLSPGAEQVTLKDNDQSLVLRLDVGKYSALFTGDSEWPIEYDLLEKKKDQLHVDYLKVAHHGSKSSNSEEFLAAVNPKIATVGVRRGNSFGHPNKKVVGRFNKLRIPLYRTDLLGAIEVEFGEKGIEVR